MTQSKTSRQCLFCDSPANSREHVIAEWLSKRMGIRDLDFGTATFSEATGMKARPTTKAQNFRTRQVCDACNGGWMSALEMWFQKRLGYLVEPSWPVLAKDMIQSLRDEGETLIRWMIKSAVVFEQAAPKGQHQVVPTDVRALAKDGVITRDFSLMLARVTAPGFTAHLVKGFPVWNGGVLHPYQQHKDGFTFAVYLNHLAIRLVRCPGGSPGVKALAYPPDCVATVPFWVIPPTDYDVAVSHAFPSFEAFLDALEIYAQKKS